jgi:hypothetical protein
VTQKVEFESVQKYAQIQLEATPMASIMANMAPDQRQALAKAIADDLFTTVGRSETEGFAFLQEAHVMLARK